MSSMTIYEISRLDLQEIETPSEASITDVKFLSSYNWIEAPAATPTIAVPGCPARWSAPRGARKLKKDSGLVYIAQNAARHPDSPLEPLFRAIYATNPSFDIRSTDVVTDRNNLRKLLSFIDPSFVKNGLEAFTMKIETTKNTTIFCRDEAKTVEYIGPREFRGFGHEFEKSHTINRIQGSTGHHRIISYCFGGMNFIVRHETDGYVVDLEVSSAKARTDTHEDLSNIMAALDLSPAISSHAVVSVGSGLVIKKEGEIVPLESTLEIKTRVSHKPIDFEEVAPQLWVSQTPNLVRAYHTRGNFRSPVVENVALKMKHWEEENEKNLMKLAALVRKIIILVKECGGNAVIKYSIEGDKLVICKGGHKKMLPEDLYSKWEDEYNIEVETCNQNGGSKGSETTQEARRSISAVSLRDTR